MSNGLRNSRCNMHATPISNRANSIGQTVTMQSKPDNGIKVPNMCESHSGYCRPTCRSTRGGKTYFSPQASEHFENNYDSKRVCLESQRRQNLSRCCCCCCCCSCCSVAFISSCCRTTPQDAEIRHLDDSNNCMLKSNMQKPPESERFLIKERAETFNDSDILKNNRQIDNVGTDENYLMASNELLNAENISIINEKIISKKEHINESSTTSPGIFTEGKTSDLITRQNFDEFEYKNVDESFDSDDYEILSYDLKDEVHVGKHDWFNSQALLLNSEYLSETKDEPCCNTVLDPEQFISHVSHQDSAIKLLSSSEKEDMERSKTCLQDSNETCVLANKEVLKKETKKCDCLISEQQISSTLLDQHTSKPSTHEVASKSLSVFAGFDIAKAYSTYESRRCPGVPDAKACEMYGTMEFGWLCSRCFMLSTLKDGPGQVAHSELNDTPKHVAHPGPYFSNNFDLPNHFEERRFQIDKYLQNTEVRCEKPNENINNSMTKLQQDPAYPVRINRNSRKETLVCGKASRPFDVVDQKQTSSDQMMNSMLFEHCRVTNCSNFVSQYTKPYCYEHIDHLHNEARDIKLSGVAKNRSTNASCRDDTTRSRIPAREEMDLKKNSLLNISAHSFLPACKEISNSTARLERKYTNNVPLCPNVGCGFSCNSSAERSQRRSVGRSRRDDTSPLIAR